MIKNVRRSDVSDLTAKFRLSFPLLSLPLIFVSRPDKAVSSARTGEQGGAEDTQGGKVRDIRGLMK